MTTQNKIKKWFVERFNREPQFDEAYFQEWVNRFKQGRAWVCMDLESKVVWKQLGGSENI